MRRLIALWLLAGTLPAAARPSLIECATYPTVLNAGGETLKGVGQMVGQLDLTTLRGEVDEETRRAISRLEAANAVIKPAMDEWSSAAADLSARVQAACGK